MNNYIEPWVHKLEWYRPTQHGYWLACKNSGMISPVKLTEIQTWCEENRCGVRKSWDSWEFKSETEITVFLLRWA